MQNLYALALTQAEMGKDEDAIGTLRRVQQIATTHADAFSFEAIVRAQSSTKELRNEALISQLADHAVGLNTRYPESWIAKAMALTLGEDPMGVIHACRQGMGTKPYKRFVADLMFLQAMAHANLKRWTKRTAATSVAWPLSRRRPDRGAKREALRKQAEAHIAKMKKAGG